MVYFYFYFQIESAKGLDKQHNQPTCQLLNQPKKKKRERENTNEKENHRNYKVVHSWLSKIEMPASLMKINWCHLTTTATTTTTHNNCNYNNNDCIFMFLSLKWMHVAIKSSQRSEWNCEQSEASNSFQQKRTERA